MSEMRDEIPHDMYAGLDMEANEIVKQFGKERLWLNWRLETKRGKDGRPEHDAQGNLKLTKVPYRLNGTFGSSTDPESRCTFVEAYEARGKFSGIGFVFEPSLNLVGVDFDHCVDPENGTIADPLLKKFLEEAHTYTEVSPSGTGLHCFFQLDEPFFPEANKRPVSGFADFPITEIYSRGRYFTFTAEPFGTEQPIRRLTRTELESVLAVVGYPWPKEPDAIEAQFIAESVAANYVSPIPENDKLLEKIFASRGGADIKALYEGDLSDYNNDHSAADLAFCSRLAFWTGKDPERMKAIWLASPLGHRVKTQTRADYQDRTIDKAIAGCIEVYRGGENPIIDTVAGAGPDYLMSGGKNPMPLLILENVCLAMLSERSFTDRFRYNDFSHMVEVREAATTKWANMKDNDVLTAQREFSRAFPEFAKVSKVMMTDAILSVASENKINPPKDYMTSLHWDGVPRLDSWLFHAYGTPDDPLHQAIGSNWIKGVVKRVMQPGCLFDEVLVLEGPQGWRKSTSLRILGQPWHVETTQSTDDKDFYLLLAQNMIVEFSEGEVLTRTEVKKLKAVITKVEDQYRPPYERGMSTFKRGCVFAMTTNDTEYQKDDTGGRRWLPVELKNPADIDWIAEHRDQLYAEAYVRVMEKNETTYEYPQELAELQASRMEHSDYEDAIIEWYLKMNPERRSNGITLRDVYHDVIAPSDNGNVREMSKLTELQIAGMVKRALYLFKKNKRVEGVVRKRWFPSDKTEQLFGIEQRSADYVEGLEDAFEN